MNEANDVEKRQHTRTVLDPSGVNRMALAACVHGENGGGDFRGKLVNIVQVGSYDDVGVVRQVGCRLPLEVVRDDGPIVSERVTSSSSPE